MASSSLILRKHPALVIDGTYEFPQNITSRVSFRHAPKIYIDAHLSSDDMGKSVLIIKQFTQEKLKEYLRVANLENLIAVYTLSGLDINNQINGKIPLINSTYASDNDITDPERDIEAFVQLIATDIGYTSVLVPWDSATTDPKKCTYGTEVVSITKTILENTYPYTAWVSSIIKQKDYVQRRNSIIALNQMIRAKPSLFDEIALFGNEDFVTSDRFTKPDNVSVKLTRVVHREKDPVCTMDTVFDYAHAHFPKHSVVFVTRSDITCRSAAFPALYSRMPTNVFGLLNPLIIPDVPDPKPELFQRGGAEVVYGCFYRTKKRPIPKDSILTRIHTHTMHAFGIAAEIASQRKLRIVNPSNAIHTWVPTGTSPIFINKTPMSIPCQKPPPSGSFFKNPVDTREVVWTCSETDVSGDIFIHPISSETGYTENKTLINMTNKYTTRKGGASWILDDISDRNVVIGTPTSIVNGNDSLFYKDSWVHIPSGTGLEYTGSGIRSQSGNLCVDHKNTHDGIIAGAPNTSIQSLVGILATAYQYNHHHKQSRSLKIIVPNGCDERDSVLNRLFNKSDLSFEMVQIPSGYIRGGESTLVVTENSFTAFLGYDPRVLRSYNRLLHSTTPVGNDGCITDILGEIDSRTQARPKSPVQPCAILVGDAKWMKCARSKLEKHTNLRLIEASDATAGDYRNASYVIGTSSGDDWACTLLVDHNRCRVIEIAPENDCDVKWFHLASTAVGCKHAYLSLKQEPSTQCKKRIKSHILSYIREEDKVSTDKHVPVTEL